MSANTHETELLHRAVSKNVWPSLARSGAKLHGRILITLGSNMQNDFENHVHVLLSMCVRLWLLKK